MITTLRKDAPRTEIEKLIHTFENKELSVTMIQGDSYDVFGLVDGISKIDEKLVKAHPFVESTIHIVAPYKEANRLFHPADTIADVAGIKVDGGEKIVVIGGPCFVEGDTWIMDIAKEVKDAGGNMLCGSACKPRMSPYALQGMGAEGVKCMVYARETYELPVASELMSADKIDGFVGRVDLIQIGTRNMQNFDLLKAVGHINKPVLLKCGLANTTKEWIMAAKCIMSEDNENVIFCERGIRTFETCIRDTLDLSVVPVVKEKTHLPIIIDPSYATGDWRLVESASLAMIATGASGLIIEVRNDPENAWSDGAQSLEPERFGEVICKGRKIAEVIGHSMRALLPLYT